MRRELGGGHVRVGRVLLAVAASVVAPLLLLAPPLMAPGRAVAEAPGRGGVKLVPGLKGWWHAGNRPAQYRVQADRTVVHGGKLSAQLSALTPTAEGFGSMMQIINAERWRGKRVRLTAYIRTREVARRSALWMRVDGSDRDGGKWLAFDAMQDRPITGTTDWTPYHIVLEVAPEATQIAFGVTLSGAGTTWVDDMKLEAVARDVPLTGVSLSALPEQPQNLGFED
jgi:hypothetical protein